MNLEEKDMYIIQHYLDGTLSDSQKEAFEARLKQEDHLRREFESQLFIREGFKGMQMQSFQKEVQNWEKALQEQDEKIISIQRRKSGKFNYLWAVAASVMLFSFFGGKWWINTNYSDKALATALFQDPSQLIIRSRGVSQGELSRVQQGIKYYEAEAYDQAIASCASVPINDPDYVQAQYYLGHSFIKTKDYPKAIQTFEGLIGKGGLKYEEPVRLNLLAAYLAYDAQNPRFHQLRNEKLANPTDAYLKQIEKLDQKLSKKFWRDLAH